MTAELHDVEAIHIGRYDLEAERYVLGAILATSGRALFEIGQLAPADFFRPEHEQLFALMHGMHGRGDVVEVQAVAQRLVGSPIRGIGLPQLVDMFSSCVTAANASYYAQTVRQLGRLRRLQAASMRIAQMTGSCDISAVDEVVEQARAEIDSAGDNSSTGEISSLGELLSTAMQRWQSPETGILPTGLLDFDDMLAGGLRPGHLLIVGARPAVGKSVVASVIAHAVARRGVGTLFCSLEMSRDEVTDRVAADIASVDVGRLTRRELRPEDWERLKTAQASASGWPLKVVDRADQTVSGVRARARDVSRRKGGLGLVVVDYLQLMKPSDSKAPRQEQVASISRGLKLLAKEMQVPVVALAQVNRGPMNRTDKRPAMSDLRESGSIEADADEIVLLHRDDKESPGEIEFIVEKNRHGRTGTVALAWAPHFSRVASMARGF
ncbi:replicative DNA helicase [Kineosporia succinea]|uniref:DNA 5'-3' helicase n=1 Tax=Kineosporia succinea TaxID=84632 RepID=A0ABT9PAA3_9ACTN|nr:replicative DNA helicase [Kineosporia succinea]MDP9829349.1 replicative DNA helicase [Kineosporia succinea]